MLVNVRQAGSFLAKPQALSLCREGSLVQQNPLSRACPRLSASCPRIPRLDFLDGNLSKWLSVTSFLVVSALCLVFDHHNLLSLSFFVIACLNCCPFDVRVTNSNRRAIVDEKNLVESHALAHLGILNDFGRQTALVRNDVLFAACFDDCEFHSKFDSEIILTDNPASGKGFPALSIRRSKSPCYNDANTAL